MRFPGRRRDAATEPESQSSGPYATRYDIARQGYEVRVGQLARALDQAALKNYLAAAANVVLGLGMVTIALRGEVRPIFVPYDAMGRVIEYSEMDRLQIPPRRVVESELAEWLVAARGIYYGDPVAQMDRARTVQAFLTPDAEQWLTQYYADPSRHPSRLLRELSRTVELESISKDPDRNLWYLQWQEIEVPARGLAAESAWNGTLVVDLVPPISEDGAWANPAGIRISRIEWNRVRHRRVAAPVVESPSNDGTAAAESAAVP